MRSVSRCLVVILLICPAIVTPVQAGGGNILILGDSLSASYGIPVESGWVNLLQQRIREQAPAYEVTNASISGETTSGALTRLPDVLERVRPAVTLIELGANDGLRGFPPTTIRNNLENMIKQIRQSGSELVLVQMYLPPNYGPAYTQRFADIYTSLASDYGIALAPFILEDMYDDPELMQDDGLHPRERAQPLILDHIWPVLKPLLGGDST